MYKTLSSFVSSSLHGSCQYKMWTRATTTRRTSDFNSFFQEASMQTSLHSQRHSSSLNTRNNIKQSLQTRNLPTMLLKTNMSSWQRPSCATLVQAAPSKVQPYLRLIRFDKPIGTQLLYLPCIYGIVLATPLGQLPNFYYLGLFGLGSVLMRSAGCVINDLWDKDLDKKVERTKSRPIAAGEISPKSAVVFLGGLLSSSLAILLSLNYTCIALGVASMVPVVLYPLAKRVTQFPQLVLGLTFNIGAVMGYTAVTGNLDLPVTSLLYLSCCIWTLHYDTIYALQDIDDDRKAGINSLARFILDDRDNDPRRVTVDRITDEMDRRRHMNVFLTGTITAHLLLLATACYLKDVPPSFNFIPVAALVYSAIGIYNMMDGFTPKRVYGEYFNSMGNVGLFISIFLMIEIYKASQQQKKDDNSPAMLSAI